MNIFISWSGNRSKAVAEILRDWLQWVIQATKPWLSTRDLDQGSVWFGEITDQLKNTTCGVVCLTSENKNAPWILFEAGGLLKGLTTNRVFTFLVDLQPIDLAPPLSQFNHTLPTKDSMFKLVRSINSRFGEGALPIEILRHAFDTYFGEFEVRFGKALEDNPPGKSVTPRTEYEILNELLITTRSLFSRTAELEKTVFAEAAARSVAEYQREILTAGRSGTSGVNGTSGTSGLLGKGAISAGSAGTSGFSTSGLARMREADSVEKTISDGP